MSSYYNAIVWQCRRTVDIIDSIAKKGHCDYIREATGLVLDAYFSASKIKWLLEVFILQVTNRSMKFERGLEARNRHYTQIYNVEINLIVA